ncbi:bifunctional anthranilate synthase component I family protein/class IV aminotransferase [Thauera aromatica]|nr:bifunctional anthranilate synthase component I family protein/class IV aminotransferase [Thauera aromatica]MCK2127040.1 bifunctional anthranilate synthase component I family protein/class IV aminotransferase [Thauera aromatica]
MSVPAPTSGCFALLDDCHASPAQPSSRLYTGFVRERRCADEAALEAVWAEVVGDIAAGLHAVLVVDYDWGRALARQGDAASALPSSPPPEGTSTGARAHTDPRAPAVSAGVLRVLLFAERALLASAEVEAWLAAQEALATGAGAQTEPAAAGTLALQPGIDRAAFDAAIARIHRAIEAGETYQLNYTYPFGVRAFGAPASLYRRQRRRQPVAYGAWIALPATAPLPPPGAGAAGAVPPASAGRLRHILSCSPELFVRHAGGRLQARPMKGTAARDDDPEADARAARSLAADPKSRAENLMIVDLLRNDIGRIARTGSVRVPALFEVERYATVWQMTSSIKAALPADTGFPAVLRALFPCGSITGAPKRRTMELIEALETGPRGLYTGSIGWIDAPPPGRACGDFCLSVAIRTLCLEAPQADGLRPGVLGVGAGIVIDSRAADEFDECRLKARFLSGLDPGFCLFETMRVSPAGEIAHLDSHLARLEASAAVFGFAFDRDAILQALAARSGPGPAGRVMRLRLALFKDGRSEIVLAPLEDLPPGPVGVLLSDVPIDGRDFFLRHKTSLRARYDAAVAQAVAHGAFDVLFHNHDGELTEGGRSNVFVRIDGEWLTPPLRAGVLPGVMRARLLADPRWQAREAVLRVADLERAQRIVLCNALRGPLPAVLRR